jgi:hypothetical protein
MLFLNTVNFQLIQYLSIQYICYMDIMLGSVVPGTSRIPLKLLVCKTGVLALISKTSSGTKIFMNCKYILYNILNINSNYFLEWKLSFSFY